MRKKKKMFTDAERAPNCYYYIILFISSNNHLMVQEEHIYKAQRIPLVHDDQKSTKIIKYQHLKPLFEYILL